MGNNLAAHFLHNVDVSVICRSHHVTDRQAYSNTLEHTLVGSVTANNNNNDDNDRLTAFDPGQPG